MIRFRNVAYESETASLTGIATAAAIKTAVFVNNTGRKVRILKATFAVQEKGSGAGTTYTVDLQKNGTTVLSTVPTLTIANITNYTTVYDTAKEIAATAPTGVSALPVLSSTVATITLAKGDSLELVVTPNGALATTAARISCTVVIEAYPS